MVEADSVITFGEELGIHHIGPIREFVENDGLDHEGANRLENLVTLCRLRHSKRETENECSGY